MLFARALAATTLGLISAAAPAQPPAPAGQAPPAARPQRIELDEAQRAAAWLAQADAVAKRLKLTPESAGSLRNIYTEARAAHAAALKQASEAFLERVRSGQTGADAMGNSASDAVREVHQIRADRFRDAVAAILTPEQTSEVVAGLGTFERIYDNAAYRVLVLGLEPDKQQSAMDAVEAYVARRAAIRARADEPDYDEAAANAEIREHRDAMIASLKAVLDADQLKSVREAVPSPKR